MAFVTRREASAITGRSVRTLIRYEERGLLRKFRHGPRSVVYDTADLDALTYLDAQQPERSNDRALEILNQLRRD